MMNSIISVTCINASNAVVASKAIVSRVAGDLQNAVLDYIQDYYPACVEQARTSLTHHVSSVPLGEFQLFVDGLVFTAQVEGGLA